ncbi:hypothetical protein HPP92_027142 [Vanilla planifolia]|uniref:Uncharacterized protein n=1 Tax=Vanilla planifolia TaxID=51239 RepID=A0A835U8E2_VANPL|nr:hypothetical protein HPP92_027142 [Vanilla planifolia]
MLAAAGQNPAAFGVNPAMLATLNPAFAGAFGAGVSQSSVSQAAMAQQGALPLQGYLMGGSGFQNVGFQGSPGFQGPPGFQGTSVSTQGVGGTVTPYQVSVEAKPSELLFNYGFYMNLLQLFKELDLVKGRYLWFHSKRHIAVFWFSFTFMETIQTMLSCFGHDGGGNIRVVVEAPQAKMVKMNKLVYIMMSKIEK